MNAVMFPEANCIYVADKCRPLPVLRIHSAKFNAQECVSLYEFTNEEIVAMLKQIQRGERPAIYLSVIGGQPPVALWLKEECGK